MVKLICIFCDIHHKLRHVPTSKHKNWHPSLYGIWCDHYLADFDHRIGRL